MATCMSIISILFFLPLQIYASQSVDSFTKFSKMYLPPGVAEPDSAFLDRHGKGPYIGVSDGRILKYNGTCFEDFAYISPNRTKEECDGVTNPCLRRKCGRPLGLAYHPITENLYIVGVFGGLYVVGPQGGLATLLATQANSVAFNFLIGIDVDVLRNVIYITDHSLISTFQDYVDGKPYPAGDSTGRLIEYNIGTGKVRVLLCNLSRPFGPTVSAAASTSVVFSSFSERRVYKYSILTGATKVLLSDLPGSPWKVKRAASFGMFWVAVNVEKQDGVFVPYGYKFDSFGCVHLIKNFSAEFPNTKVAVVQEYKQGLLYVGAKANYLGVYTTC